MAEKIAKAEHDNIVSPLREWPARLRATTVVLGFIFGVAALIVILKNDLVNKQIEETENLVLDYIGAKAMALDDVVITGRGRTTMAEINRALEVKRGDNLLKIRAERVKHRLEELPWVRDVSVSRHFFPNVLQIDIQEKNVMALWQLNERFYPLDMNGYVIEADYRPDKPILLVVGAEAPENVVPFLTMLRNIDEKYAARIKVVNYISMRRWNVVLDDIQNGVTVKLPEEKADEAWKKLIKLDTSKGILKRKLTIIDLRLPGKVTVKLRKSKIGRTKTEQAL
jgi:cell division protein FtsQ